MATWALYWKLVGARVRAQMQYKVSFWLDLLTFAVWTVLDFVVVAILLTRFRSLGGWSIAEVALLYGLTTIAFGITEMIARGFDSPFEAMMQQGTFDNVLTRPLGSFFQIMASEFQLRRLGRALQGAVVLLYAFSHLEVAWTPAKLLLIPVTVVSGTLIYLSLFVMGATICFWTIKAPEVVNAFTFGGNQMTSYPLSIYNRWMRNFFIFVIPLAFVNYPTALVLLDRRDPFGLPAWLAWIAPGVALVFFAVSRAIWSVGVTKYSSSGS